MQKNLEFKHPACDLSQNKCEVNQTRNLQFSEIKKSWDEVARSFELRPTSPGIPSRADGINALLFTLLSPARMQRSTKYKQISSGLKRDQYNFLIA